MRILSFIIALFTTTIIILNGCQYSPPYNNFEPYNSVPVDKADIRPMKSQTKIINILNKNDIQFIQYGDKMTLIIPTDRYFLFNSQKFNEVYSPCLINVIRLLKSYPNSAIYIASFTDDIGSIHHKNRISQARSETMLAFLWANNIKLAHLNAQGYADHFTVANNKSIHGSAQNRRIEIQWINNSICRNCYTNNTVIQQMK